jgi:transposase
LGNVQKGNSRQLKTRVGHRNCEIVKLLHIPESTIRSIWKEYNSTGNVENIPRVGRPRKVTRCGEVRLLRTVKKNRGKVLREITNDFNEGGVVRCPPKDYTALFTQKQNI